MSKLICTKNNMFCKRGDEAVIIERLSNISALLYVNTRKILVHGYFINSYFRRVRDGNN